MLDSLGFLWTMAHQAPLSMGFLPGEPNSSGLPCPPPGDLPDPGIETNVSYVCCIGFFTTSATWEAHSWPHPLLIPDLFLLILIPLGRCVLMSPVFLVIPVSSWSFSSFSQDASWTHSSNISFILTLSVSWLMTLFNLFHSLPPHVEWLKDRGMLSLEKTPVCHVTCVQIHKVSEMRDGLLFL